MDQTKRTGIKSDKGAVDAFSGESATINGPSMSYFMPNDIPWEEQASNSRRKIIRLEDDIYIALIQWDAGFKRASMDNHGGEETLYVLDGTFNDGGPACGPGSIIRGDAGSSHTPWTEDGCTFFVTKTLAPGEREKIAGPGGWKRP